MRLFGRWHWQLKNVQLTIPKAKKSLVDGWVSMEDNEQCNYWLAEEVNQLMDLEVICNLNQLSIENNKDNDEEEDALEEDKRKEPVTFDEVNNLAVQLRNLQVQIGTLGGEYHAASLAVSDANDNLWSIYHKNKNKDKEISKKQKATNQTSIKAFFNK